MDHGTRCIEDTGMDADLTALDALELDMPALQARANNLFALATAWAERHDAIIAATPAASLGVVEARLRRMGIRWGMVPGVRMTGQMPTLPAAPAGDASVS